jgi:hypothetical protein
MATLPRQQVKNIIAGLSADGYKTRHMPLRFFATDEKSLHQLTMLVAEVLGALSAEGLEPTDFERTSVLYRLLAHLANKPSLKLSAALRKRIRVVATYIAHNPAHLSSDLSFNDLLTMARHAPRAPRKQNPEDQYWVLKAFLEICREGAAVVLGVSLTAFAAVGFCITPLLFISPQQFGQSSLDGWRALLAPPPCGEDCRIPIPLHRGLK